MTKDKIIKYCNKVIEISIYGVIFYIPISNALIEIFISLAIVSWLIKKIVQRSKILKFFYPTYLNIPILLYVLACIASSIFSSNPRISFTHFFLKTSEYLIFFFIVVERLDKRILKNSLITLVIIAGLQGIDGIFQYFTNWDFFRQRIPVIRSRISASFYYPNDFATYLITVLPIILSLFFIKFKKFWIKASIALISFLLFICLILSATRSVWLALTASILFALILRHKKLVLFMLVLIVISLSLFPLFSDIAKERIVNFFSINFSDAGGYLHRKFLWQIGLDMFRASPIFGQGLGTFMYNFEKFQPKDYPSNWGICYAHNCFLQTIAEIGILGLSTFISIIISLFLTSYRYLKRIKENYFYYAVLSGTLIGIFAYLVDAFFDTSLYSLSLAVLFWLMVALVVGTLKIIKTEKLNSEAK